MTDSESRIAIQVGGLVDEVKLVVPLCTDLVPLELTELLRISPTSSHVRGDRRVLR